MLIIALALAVVSLAALVAAVVTSNELIAYFCIGASVFGVVLLIVDALRERQHRAADGDTPSGPDAAAKSGADAAIDEQHVDENPFEDYPEDSGSEAEASSHPSAAGASAEPGGSDEYDHGSAEQSAVGTEDTDTTR